MLKTENGKLKTESGFTLIEIMVSTVITMMIIGAIYAAFRSSLNIYQRDEMQIIMLQRCRSALDRMTRDVSNLFYIADDEEMALLSEDYADAEIEAEAETEANRDMISFVALVEPRVEEYYIAMEEQSNTLLGEEEENPLPSDLARIVYYIGPNPKNEGVQSLMRIQTSNLDTEELEELLEEATGGSLSEELQEELESSVLVDYVGGLNIRYYDPAEEDWVDLWDMEEQEGIPSAVEITLTITDADTQEKTLTQAVVVYLPLSQPPTDEDAAGMVFFRHGVALFLRGTCGDLTENNISRSGSTCPSRNGRWPR